MQIKEDDVTVARHETREEAERFVDEQVKFATRGMWTMWLFGFAVSSTFFVSRDYETPLVFALVCIFMLLLSNFRVYSKGKYTRGLYSITCVDKAEKSDD